MPVKNPPKTVQEAIERYMMTALRAAERRVRAGEFNPAEFNVLMSAARPVLAALQKAEDSGTGSNIDELRRALQDANSGRNAGHTGGRPRKGTVPGYIGERGEHRPAKPSGSPSGPHEERPASSPDGFANTDPVGSAQRALSALAEPHGGNSADLAGAGEQPSNDPANDPRGGG